MVLPRGPGFIDYPVFDQGYEVLKRVTGGFRDVLPAVVEEAVREAPIAMIVLRCMLGFTPSEWAYVASQHGGIDVSQGAARTIDRRIRLAPEKPLSPRNGKTGQRIKALIAAACDQLAKGPPPVPPQMLHRLDKADTAAGLISLQALAQLGVPYSMLLYERFLGRPFAGHRDSVSEHVGGVLEAAIEDILDRFGISSLKTKRAQRVPGFDQAPDFVVPSIHNPQVVIEAKLTEDDGTARDKVTRVQHLHTLSLRDQPPDRPRFEVVACIAGRGFRVRREDMRKLLLATAGKVFTLQTLDRLVACTRLKTFVTRTG